MTFITVEGCVFTMQQEVVTCKISQSILCHLPFTFTYFVLVKLVLFFFFPTKAYIIQYKNEILSTCVLEYP